MLQCVAVCCSVLQCASLLIFLHTLFHISLCYYRPPTTSPSITRTSLWQCVAVCCCVLQCVVVCCSVLQCVAVCCSVLQCVAVCHSVLQCVAVCCSVLHYASLLVILHIICTHPFVIVHHLPPPSLFAAVVNRLPPPLLPAKRLLYCRGLNHSLPLLLYRARTHTYSHSHTHTHTHTHPTAGGSTARRTTSQRHGRCCTWNLCYRYGW